MLSRFTLRSRLVAAFVVVLLSTVGLGLFSIQRLTTVNAAAGDVATNWLPAANVLGSLSQDFELLRSRQGQVLLVDDSGRAEILGKISNAHAKVEADLKAYGPLISPGRERVLADAITSSMAAYMKLDAPYRARIAAGDLKGATDFFLHGMKSGVDGVRTAIAADRDYQMNEGQGAANAGIAQGNAACLTIWLTLAVSTLICVVIGWALIRGISAPINRMASTMGTLAGGDVAVRIPNLGEPNEIGAMASAVDVFRQGMIRTRALEEEAAVARAGAEVQRRKIMTELADQFENAVGSIVHTVSAAAVEMQATASQLTANATEASVQATSVSAAAEEAGTNVTSVAASAEELSASVGEIGRQVGHSHEKARQAVVKADQTAAIVDELSEAAGRINGIVKLISDIASQTNLLALNATIESARAGEAGKGFAVVAAEVKTLANQTSQATADINAQISGVQETTQRAVEAIDSISGIIRDISESSSTIAAAVEQQGAATHEIVQAVTQASAGTAEVTYNITGVARMAEETGSGASQVLSASSELARQAEHLRHQMMLFLDQVRAA